VVFAFQAIEPSLRYPAPFVGHVLIVVYYAYLGGRVAGFTVSGAAFALTLLAWAISPAGERMDAFSLGIFPALLVALVLLIDQATKEQRLAIARLAEANEELKRLDEVRSELVAIVAHDLRSPMSTISGFADTLRARWAELPDAQREEFLEAISRNITSLADLTENVLQVTRIESGNLSYEIAPFDLGELVRRISAELAEAERIRVHIPDGLPRRSETSIGTGRSS